MRNSILFLVATFILPMTLLAQSNGDLEFGANVGVNFSNATNDTNTTDTKAGFNIGASGEYYFSDRWGIKAKAIYDQKGWANGFVFNQNTGQNITTDFNNNYLTIPVMANWHFAKSRRWYMHFGPQVGFLLSAEDSVTGLDVKEAFQSTDFGIALGIGHKFPLSDDLQLNLEYDSQGGISDIFENSNTDNPTRNGRNSLNIGLVF